MALTLGYGNMNIDQRIIGRLDQLIADGQLVIGSNYSRSGDGVVYFGDQGVNSELTHKWGTSCLNILGRVFGENSDHYKKFNQLFPQFHNLTPVKKRGWVY